MTTKSPAGSATDIDLAALEQLARAATRGPWTLDTTRSEGEYGTDEDGGVGFTAYIVADEQGRPLMDSLNRDQNEIHEEYSDEERYAWDELAKRDAQFIAAANPATVLALIALARATPQHPEAPADVDGDDIEQRTERIRLAHANPVGRSRTHLIRDAEHLLAHIALLRSATPQHSVTEQASIDTPEFRVLLSIIFAAGVAHLDASQDYEKVIAYIDSRAQPLPSTAATQPEQASIRTLPGCLADRLYEALAIARAHAQHDGSMPRMKKWDDTAADLRAALAIPASTATARDATLEEAAVLCEAVASDKYDQYKGRGKYAANNPHRADTYTSGESDGADLCADKIRALKCSDPASTAASEQQADDLAWHKEALAAVRGKLESVWEGIRDAVQKYSGQPCEGEPFSRLDELLSRLSTAADSEQQASVSEVSDKIVCPSCNGMATYIGQHDGYDDAGCHMCDGSGKVAALSGRATIPSDADERAMRLIHELGRISMTLAADLVQGAAYTFEGHDYLDRESVVERVMRWRTEWDATAPARAALTHRATTATAEPITPPLVYPYDKATTATDQHKWTGEEIAAACVTAGLGILECNSLLTTLKATEAYQRCAECSQPLLRHEWNCRQHIDNRRATTAADSRLTALDAANTLLEDARRQREERCTRLGLDGGAAADQQGDTASASGAHHLTPDNIAATIRDLREIEDGTTERPVIDRDWRTWAGVLARIMEHLAQQGAAQAQASDARELAHGHREDFYLIANARRLALQPIHKGASMPNWVLATELFGTGSTSAHQICRDAGIDPDGYKVDRAAIAAPATSNGESNG